MVYCNFIVGCKRMALTLDRISLNISLLEVELAYLKSVYWEYKANLKTEEDLRIAYNKFRAKTQCVCPEED